MLCFDAIGEVYPSWSFRFQDIQGPLTWCQWIQFPRGWSRQCKLSVWRRAHRIADRSGETDMKSTITIDFLDKEEKIWQYIIDYKHRNPAKEPKTTFVFYHTTIRHFSPVDPSAARRCDGQAPDATSHGGTAAGTAIAAGIDRRRNGKRLGWREAWRDFRGNGFQRISYLMLVSVELIIWEW